MKKRKKTTDYNSSAPIVSAVAGQCYGGYLLPRQKTPMKEILRRMTVGRKK